MNILKESLKEGISEKILYRSLKGLPKKLADILLENFPKKKSLSKNKNISNK